MNTSSQAPRFLFTHYADEPQELRDLRWDERLAGFQMAGWTIKGTGPDDEPVAYLSLAGEPIEPPTDLSQSFIEVYDVVPLEGR